MFWAANSRAACSERSSTWASWGRRPVHRRWGRLQRGQACILDRHSLPNQCFSLTVQQPRSSPRLPDSKHIGHGVGGPAGWGCGAWGILRRTRLSKAHSLVCGGGVLAVGL